MGPMTDEGRLVAWAANPAEEAVYQAIGMAGEMPAPVVDGLAVTFNNGAGNKIDFFLTSEAVYSVHPDPTTGLATATLSMTLTNSAPAAGLPSGVIDNEEGFPIGTNYTYLSVYSVLPFTSVTVDGAPASFISDTEAGYEVASGYVELGAGQTIQVELAFEGPMRTETQYRVAVRTQAAVSPMQTTVLVNDVPITEVPIADAGVVVVGRG